MARTCHDVLTTIKCIRVELWHELSTVELNCIAVRVSISHKSSISGFNGTSFLLYAES